MIFPPIREASSIREKLSLISRSDIDGVALQFPNNLPFLSEFEFHRLRRKPKLFDESGNDDSSGDISEALLIGLYASQNPYCYVIDSYSNHIEIYFGSKSKTAQQSSPVYKAIFDGYWGADCLVRSNGIKSRIEELNNYSVCGAITGIPNVIAVRTSVKRLIPSDHWMKSLQGRRWTYIISGFCISRDLLAEYRDQIISEIAMLKTRTIREDILYEEKRFAEHYQGVLEANLKRFEYARLTGMWQVGVYFFAEDEMLIRQGLGILSAHLGGKKSIIQPIRSHLCSKDSGLKPSFSNLLISSEASSLISIPDEEVPGYTVQKVAMFDSDTMDSNAVNPVTIGNILLNRAITDNKYAIELADLTKHGLIAGVTGSGKTTTCFYLLKQLKQKNIPFLVIESAKSEYRQLLNDPLFKDMLVFTLGDETPDSATPFRINPFEVPDGILIQTHLDYLKSLFRASFVMYAPMPYVLEEALYEVYRDKGWNLSENSNERGTGARAYPTLTDLYEKIDEVVSRLGYDERISKDILAGLKTRINNLRLGGKGLMLDTCQSVPIVDIMRKPVLIELKRLGSDDEKAFLIGIILTRLYEYYEAKTHDPQSAKGLKHLTLIEEAHRLLKHVPEEASEMDGNVRSKAVETFCNMLSEIRAYGEGVIVSEQIPDKLARDLIKNTNLKIMHRIVAKDDRDIMGDTMNLTDEQKKYVTTLDKGRAVVFAEGMDSPFLIYVPISELLNTTVMAKPVSNRYLYQHMKETFYHQHKGLLLKYKACTFCFLGKKRCESAREIIKMLLSERKNRMVFKSLFIVAGLDTLRNEMLTDVNRLIRENMIARDKDDLKNMCLCYIIQAAFLEVESQGRLYDYSFNEMDHLSDVFIELMQSLIFDNKIDSNNLEKFQRMFVELRTKSEAPYTGCIVCNKVCLYRFESSYFLYDAGINADIDYITTKIDDDNSMWIELAKLCQTVSRILVPVASSGLVKRVAICYLSQKVAQAGYPPRIQEKVAKNINDIYEKGIVTV
jgi:DNA helicase HerA-like ATPase